MKTLNLICVLLAFVPGVLSASIPGIYIASGVDRTLIRTDLSGANPTTVLTVGGTGIMNNLAYDPINEKVYWTISNGDRRIMRANLDGTGLETLYTFVGAGAKGAINPVGLLLDPVGGMMYFTDIDNMRLWSGNLNGGTLATVTDLVGGFLMADPVGITSPDGMSLVYTRASINEGIYNFPGGLFLSAIKPTGIAADYDNDRYFYIQTGGGANNTLSRVNFDGTGNVHLLTNLNFVNNGGSLYVESETEKIYWSEQGNNANAIKRANFDGTDVETLYTQSGTNYLYGMIVVVPEPGSAAALFGIGVLVFAATARRRRTAA